MRDQTRLDSLFIEAEKSFQVLPVKDISDFLSDMVQTVEIREAVSIVTHYFSEILEEKAIYELSNDQLLRKHYGRLIQLSMSDYIGEIAKMRDICQKVINIGEYLSCITAKPILIIFNARGASPLAFAGNDLLNEFYRQVQLDHNDTQLKFGDRKSECIALSWLANHADQSLVLPISHFKISSRRYVTSERAVGWFGDYKTEHWRNRSSWSACCKETKEYIPLEIISLLELGVPMLFVDMPTRRDGFSTACGILQSEKEFVRAANGAHDPYKLLPLLNIYGYNFFRGVIKPSCKKPSPHEEVFEHLKKWCIFLNPDVNGDAQFWDNKPQLALPWSAEYSEYISAEERHIQYINLEGKYCSIDI